MPLKGMNIQCTYYRHRGMDPAGGGKHDELATGKTWRGKGQVEGCHVPPITEVTPQVDILGPMVRLLPSSVWTGRRWVKHGQSGGSVGTTYQGKGRVCRGVRRGLTGGARALGGERPLGIAACVHANPPPPTHVASPDCCLRLVPPHGGGGVACGWDSLGLGNLAQSAYSLYALGSGSGDTGTNPTAGKFLHHKPLTSPRKKCLYNGKHIKTATQIA